MTTDPPKTRRRWLQFSLQTLFVVMTVFCVWMGFTAKRARDQRQAVEAIEKVGGEVRYEHQFVRFEHQFKDYNYYSDPPGPEWLRPLIGNEYFFSVDQVRLVGPKVNDASLTAIEGLPNVQQLFLYDTLITDAGLVRLKALSNLQAVNLRFTQVTEEGVKKLQQGLPNCKIVYTDKNGMDRTLLPVTSSQTPQH